MGREGSKRRRAHVDTPNSEDEITPAPPRPSVNGKRHLNGKPKSTRRRVKFVDAPPSPLAREPPPSSAGDMDADVPLADMTGAGGLPSHSLLEDGTGAGVTAFDLTDELGDGMHDAANDDGVIPASLQRIVQTEADEAADVSSSDDDGDARATRARAERDVWADAMASASAPAADVPTPAARPQAPKRRRQKGPSAGDAPPVLSRASAVATLARLLLGGETGAQATGRLKRAQRRDGLDSVTDACHALLGHGVFSALDLTREEVLAEVKWELAWGREREGRKVHGPFEAKMMQEWERARYFSQKGKRAWVRPYRAAHVQWVGAREVFEEK